MRYAPWAASLIASTLAGLFLCRALVARRRSIAVLLLGAVAAIAVTALSWATIWNADGRIDSLVASVALAIAAGAGGYALGAAMIGGGPRVSTAPVALVAGAARGGTDVVLLADEEPESYDPSAVSAGLARYEDGDIDLPPEIARPLIYASERARYRRSGGSPARGTVRAIAGSLERLLGATDGDVSVSAAFCEGEGRLDAAVADLVARGGRTIIVAPLSAAWSPAFDTARDALPFASLAAAGVSFEVADPLWSSPHLSAMVAARVLSCLGGDRSTDGVVLVSMGDPWEHATSHETYREQLTFLTQRVRAELIGAGVSAGRIQRAWLWLDEPDVAEAVRHLAALGARNVVIAPVTVPVETLATLSDLRFAAELAAEDTGASVTVLPAWGDDPAVVAALADAIAVARARLTAVE